MQPVEVIWPAPPPAWQRAWKPDGPAQAHVWAIPLDPGPEELDLLMAGLSSEERARAERYRVDEVRTRFITGRGTMRAILARYLEATPGRLEFTYGTLGKPALSGPWAGSGLHFNLAHSRGLALLAVTWSGPVGVDVEMIRSTTDAEHLVARFFSSGESALFQTTPPERRLEAFFNLWTRKESWLKATGQGIGALLSQVEVSFLPGDPARLVRLPPETPAGAAWRLHSLAPATGFVGALAMPLPEVRLACWRWEQDGGECPGGTIS